MPHLLRAMKTSAFFTLAVLGLAFILAAPAGAVETPIEGDLALPRWNWHVFGPVKRDDPIPAAATLKTMPAELKIGDAVLKPRPVNVEDRYGRHNLGSLLGGTDIGKTAYVFIPFTAPSDMRATFGFGADWWLQAWLDGELIMDTTTNGNDSWPPTVLDHRATVSLAKGAHVLAVRYISGSGSSILAIGGPNELRLGPPPYPLSLFQNTPMPPGNLVANGGFEDGPEGNSFVPAGWINGRGRRGFRAGELAVRTNAPIYGKRSLEINTLSGASAKRVLRVPLATRADTCYEITFKACHLAGDGYISVSARNDAESGFNTGFVRGIGVDNSYDRYNQAIKKGQLGAARAYYFFDTENPCLFIQTHGPVHAVIDDVCVVPVERGKMWSTWSEQRTPTRLDWTSLDGSVVTPHTAWAKPYAGGTLNILSLMPRKKHRRTVELAQRFDMEALPLFFEWGRGGPNGSYFPGYDYWVYDEEGDPSLFFPEADLLSKLARPADCILISDLDASAITPRMAEAILEKVATGAGLVIVASPYIVKDLPAFTAGPWAPALNESNRTAEGTGWIGLEAAAVNLDPAAKPGFYHYGKGRIALWPMHVGDTRDSLDLRLPPVFKAMAWAAGKTPSVRVEKLALPGTPRGVRGAVAWRSVLPGRLDVSLASEGPLPQGTTVRAWIDNFTDEPSLPLGDRAPDSSEGGTGFEIPVLPVGKHLVHVQVLRGSRVEDWATAQLEVVAPSAIQSLKLDRASRLFAAGEPITGRVILDAPLPPDRRLRMELTDADGRLWASQEAAADAATNAFSLPTDPAVILWHTVSATLLDATGRVATARVNASIVRHPAWYSRFFDFQLWCIPTDNYPATRELRRLGISSDYHAFAARNHAMNNIRGGPTAGLHYEQSNAPGLFFPHHKTEIVGDKAHAPIRYPCLNDPGYRTQMVEKIHGDIVNQLCNAPQAYSLAHEWNYRAYGSLAGPVDTCFCSNCLAGFREFARSEHGTLERLNAAWGSAFTNWDDVAPLVLADALEAGQVPRWIDHRRYADQVFADFFKLKLTALRQLDPAAEGGGVNLRVGLTTLDSYSGVDFWKLYHETGIFSYLENPYVSAFTPPDSPRRRLLIQLVSLWHPDRFCADERLLGVRIRNLPWKVLLLGARGFGYYEEYFFMPPFTPFQPILNADLTSSDRIRTLAAAVGQIRAGLNHFLVDSRMSDSGIALLYSRASEHAATAWQASQTNRLAERISPPDQMGFYSKALNALGYSFTAVSDDQAAAGALAAGGYRLLVLPFAQAISTGAVEQIRTFVRGGGCLLADIRPGLGDLHGVAGAAGLLDDVFGVRHKTELAAYEPIEDVAETEGGPVRIIGGPAVALDGARPGAAGRASARPLFLEHRFGQGRAWLMNCVFAEPDEAALEKTGALLAAAGLQPLFSVEAPARRQAAGPALAAAGDEAPADAEGYIAGNRALDRPVLTEFVNGRIRCFGFRNPVMRGLGHERLVITPPVPGHIYDLQSGRYLGRKERFAITLALEDTAFFASVPYRIRRPDLTLAEGKSENGLMAIRCQARMNPAEAAAEGHVIQFRLFGPDGTEWTDFAMTVTSQDGSASHEFVLPANAPQGRWRIEAREAISGLTAKQTITCGP